MVEAEGSGMNAGIGACTGLRVGGGIDVSSFGRLWRGRAELARTVQSAIGLEAMAIATADEGLGIGTQGGGAQRTAP